jgi:hypothetical protein
MRQQKDANFPMRAIQRDLLGDFLPVGLEVKGAYVGARYSDFCDKSKQDQFPNSECLSNSGLEADQEWLGSRKSEA